MQLYRVGAPFESISTQYTLFLIIIVFWLNEANGPMLFLFRIFGLEFCKGSADCVKLSPGTLVNVVLIMQDVVYI